MEPSTFSSMLELPQQPPAMVKTPTLGQRCPACTQLPTDGEGLVLPKPAAQGQGRGDTPLRHSPLPPQGCSQGILFLQHLPWQR